MPRICYPAWLHNYHDTFIRMLNVVPGKGFPLRTHHRYQPFFIIGSGRSGTTLLRRLLLAHDDLFIPPELSVFGRCIQVWRRVHCLEWDYMVRLVLSLFEYQPDLEIPGESLRPLARKLNSVDISERSLACVINLLMRTLAERFGTTCTVWGEKSPVHTFVIDRLLTVFPDAKLIHVLRDGCDVVPSYIESGIYTNMISAAHRWKASTAIARRACKTQPAFSHVVRYEHLVQQPESTLMKLCEFLAIPYSSNMLSTVKTTALGHDVATKAHHAAVTRRITTSSIGRGREYLCGKDTKVLRQILNPLLNECGYDPCP